AARPAQAPASGSASSPASDTRPQPPRRQGAVVLRALTADEVDARAQALADARVREIEERRRAAEEEARRRAAEEEARRLAELAPPPPPVVETAPEIAAPERAAAETAAAPAAGRLARAVDGPEEEEG